MASPGPRPPPSGSAAQSAYPADGDSGQGERTPSAAWSFVWRPSPQHQSSHVPSPATASSEDYTGKGPPSFPSSFPAPAPVSPDVRARLELSSPIAAVHSAPCLAASQAPPAVEIHSTYYYESSWSTLDGDGSTPFGLSDSITSLSSASAASSPGPHSPTDCLGGIRSHYLSAVLVDPVTGEPHRLQNYFVTPVLAECDASRTSAAEGASLESYWTPRKIDSVLVENLFSRCFGSSKRVDIIGGAGFGKSSLCKFIAREWAAGRLFQQFQLEALVSLQHLTSTRYPPGVDYTIVDVVIRECLNSIPTLQLREDVGEAFDPKTTLWILDGFDAIADRLPSHLSDLMDAMLSAPNRILTARPQAMRGLREPCKGDVALALAGLPEASIHMYVEAYATRVGISDEVLLQHFRRSQLILELARSPVNLARLCHVFADASSASVQLSLTQVYSRVESLIGRRFCTSPNEDSESSVIADGVRQPLVTHQDVLDSVSDVAFQATKAGALTFTGESILKWIPRGLHGSMLLPALQRAGLLAQVDGDEGNASFLFSRWHFQDLTLQEYFAARRVAAALSEVAPLSAEEMSWLRTHKYSTRSSVNGQQRSRLEVMWWFVGGLVGDAAHHVCPNYAGVVNLAALWTEGPRDIGGVFEARVWLRMIEEGRLWRLPAVIKPDIIKDVIAFATPVMGEVSGEVTPVKWRSIHFAVREAFGFCPLLCKEVLLASVDVCLLVRRDCPAAVKVLGRALLHCDWVWPILRQQILNDVAVDWDNLSPELFGCPQLFGMLRECTLSSAQCRAATSASSSTMSLLEMLDDNPYAVVEWMEAVFLLDRRRVVYELSIQLLTCSRVDRFVHHSGVVNCIRSALTGDVHAARESAVRILQPLGPKLLDVDWAVDWCKSCITNARPGQVHHILMLFAHVGERGLQVPCDWLHGVVMHGLSCQSFKDTVVSHAALDIMSSMIPFVSKPGFEPLLGLGLVSMSKRLWGRGELSRLVMCFSKCPIQLLSCTDAVDIMMSCCAHIRTSHPEVASLAADDSSPDVYTLAVALMSSCGPAVFSCVWYTDWLEAACQFGGVLLRHALDSIPKHGAAVVRCDVAMRVLQSCVGSKNVTLRVDVTEAIPTLFLDDSFRRHRDVTSWLRKLVYDTNPTVRLNANVMLPQSVPLLSAACETDTLLEMLREQDPLNGAPTALANVRPDDGPLQSLALNGALLSQASQITCITLDGHTGRLVIESPAGPFQQTLTVEQMCNVIESGMNWPEIILPCFRSLWGMMPLPTSINRRALGLHSLALAWHWDNAKLLACLKLTLLPVERLLASPFPNPFPIWEPVIRSRLAIAGASVSAISSTSTEAIRNYLRTPEWMSLRASQALHLSATQEWEAILSPLDVRSLLSSYAGAPHALAAICNELEQLQHVDTLLYFLPDIFSIMRSHPASPIVQAACCDGLSACGHFRTDMVSHRRILPLVTRLGGIELILTAMSRFCDDDWVLVTGWAALASWMYVERDMLVPVELLESVLSSVSPQAVAEALVKSDSADFDTEVVKFVEYGCACGVSNAVSVAMRSPIVNSNQRCVRSVVQCASAVAFTPLGASTLLKVAPVFIGAIRVREYGYLDPLPAALRALFWIAMHHPSAVPSWVANDALSRCGLVSQLKSVLDDAKQQLMNEGLENLSARPVVVSGLWLLFALTCQRDGRSALTRAGGAALFTPLVEVFPWDDDLQSLIRYVVQLLTLGVE